MWARLAELNPRKAIILVMLALIAGRLGWSAISPYLNTAQSDTEQCQTLESNIRTLLAEANHCNRNEDCMEAELACPFGCNTYVNMATSLVSIRDEIHKYNEQCGFCVEECARIKPVCVNHQCLSFATLPEENYDR